LARALLLFTSLLLLAGCAHRRDADIRKNLPGAWHLVQPALDQGGMKITFTIAPNGDFKREILITSNGVTIVDGVDMAGTWQIQDGHLIQAVTYMGLRRNAHLPQVSRAKIIHADDSGMVVVFDGVTEKDTFRKDTR
jgi:hypothetical protein